MRANARLQARPRQAEKKRKTAGSTSLEIHLLADDGAPLTANSPVLGTVRDAHGQKLPLIYICGETDVDPSDAAGRLYKFVVNLPSGLEVAWLPASAREADPAVRRLLNKRHPNAMLNESKWRELRAQDEALHGSGAESDDANDSDHSVRTPAKARAGKRRKKPLTEKASRARKRRSDVQHK